MKKIFSGIEYDEAAGSYIVPKRDLPNVCKYVKDTDDLSFDYLKCLTAVDYAEKVEVVYELYSFKLNLGIKIKVALMPNDLKLPSVVSFWAAADWFEREVYDMFGIVFEGHPDLKRILLDDGWKGHPLRKDYTDERIVKKPS
ncbi:MAG TPA: NADH-quinone oxidoreductase subunit C [bacterium]|nr:NADH-quinone oxidoreductase subunit C [bacterium]